MPRKTTTTNSDEIAEQVGAQVASLFLTPATDAPKSAAKPKTSRKANTTVGGTKLVTNKADITEDSELGIDIPVVRANGDSTTLDEIEPKKKAVAAPKPATQAVPKAASASGKAAGSKAGNARSAALTQAEQIVARAREKAAETERKAKEKIQAQQKKLKDQQAQQRETAKAKKEAEKKAAAEKREADKLARAQEREEKKAADKAEREAAKLRGIGETGDPEADAVFHAAVDEARTLSIVPTRTAREIDLSFLSIEGVSLSGVSLTLPENLSLAQWAKVTAGLNAVKEVSQFAIGDALRFGEERYGKQYDVVTEALGLEKQTVKNYKYVAGVFAKDVRVDGLGFTHHLEVAGLYQNNPVAALNILAQALIVDEKTGRVKPSTWVRQQVQALRGDAPKQPTERKAENAELVSLGTEAFEAALEDLGGDVAAVNRQVNRDAQALVEYAQENDVAPSDSVIRNVLRLQGLLSAAQAEAAEWKQRAEAAEARLTELGEAQARVAAHTEATEDFGTEAVDVLDGTDI